jgi:hypothetical protein
MKSRFSRAFALGFLACASLPSWAQPDIMPPETPVMPSMKLGQSSADALALIGAFYTKLRRAESFRGRYELTSTFVKEGKVISKTTFELKSSWIDDGEREGVFNKSVQDYDATYTNLEKGTTTTEKIHSVDNGIKNYRFDETKNVWSERTQKVNGTPIMLRIAQDAFAGALAVFGAGSAFKVERKLIDGQERFIVKNSPVKTVPTYEYIFDANTGNLQSVIGIFGESRQEARWLQSEFDVPLDDSIFSWKVPENAKQVAPEEMASKMMNF